MVNNVQTSSLPQLLTTQTHFFKVNALFNTFVKMGQPGCISLGHAATLRGLAVRHGYVHGTRNAMVLGQSLVMVT